MSTPTPRALLPVAVETDRLRLERLDADNPATLTLYDHLGRHAPDIEATTTYVTWDPHQTPCESHELQQRAEEKWEQASALAYVVRPRDTEDGAGEMAGTTGLWFDWDRRTATAGIWLREPFWGRGYSGERADAMLDLTFDRFDLDLLRVGHIPENEQSARAIQKYVDRHGGRREETFRHEAVLHSGDVVDVAYYTISQDEWREADGAKTAIRYPDD